MNRFHARQYSTPIIVVDIKSLNDLRKQIKSLQEQEKTISKRIIGFLEASKLSQIECDGIKAVVTVCEKMDVNPIQYRDKVSDNDFFESVTVSTAAARKLLGDVQLRRIASVSTYPQLRLSEV